MNTPINQYIELYDSARELLGNRDDARQRLLECSAIDNVFAPTDYGVNLQRIALPVDVAKSFGCDVPAVSAVPAVIVNDIFASAAKLDERLPDGVKVISLRKAVKECPHLIPDFTGGYDDAETRINDLLWSDGVLIYVAPGVRLEKPLQLVNIFSAPMNLMAFRRIVVHIADNAAADLLVCDHTQDSERRYLSDELIQITVNENSRFGIDFIEESSALTTRRTTINATLADNASLKCTTAILSCGDSHIRTHVDINGNGARAEVNGMVIADKKQQPGFDTRIVHHAEHSSSNQLFKFVADGESKCTYNGRIIVKEEAKFTEAYQTNRNILAAQTATMHTEPTLEIYCDEVKCSHGATTGQLDDNALFYMRQRGIPLVEARKMLMESFVSDIIDSVHIPGLRERLRHLVERRFSGLGSDVVSCADCNLNTPSCNVV